MTKFSFLAAMAFAVAASGAAAQTPPSGGTITPVRPPDVPLIVRQPYVSTWQPANSLAGTWPAFWTGAPKGMCGIARIDGKAFVFMGAPMINGQPAAPLMTQTALHVTPTQSEYTFREGGITLSLDFLSPVEPNDLRRQSIPLSYIFANARSSDGQTHTVSLYFDITGEWATGDNSMPITWQNSSVGGGAAPLTAFTVTAQNPRVLRESGDQADWGQVVWATASGPSVTTESGADTDVRAAAIAGDHLSNTQDTNQPRAINDHWPVFAYDFNLGPVGAGGSKPITLMLGDVRDPAVSYLQAPVPPLWKSYWPDWQGMLAFFYADAANERRDADALDRKVTTDATRAGGAHYAALCTLALRQAFGATELVGTAQQPWMFMKEISSDGNISTLDVVYPSFPVFLYTNPYLVRLQLDPLLAYAESGKWTQPFAEHDIGASYPNANGHNDGGGENMPVEESANALIMAAAYMRYAPRADAAAYAKQHYTVLKRWADYLLSVPDGGTYPNALDPLYQNQTDDFTGPIAHSVNLALKGILGVGGMGQIAGFAGNSADAAHYSAAARQMIGQWAKLAQSTTGPHLTMQYNEADTPKPAHWATGVVGAHALALGGSARAEAAAPVVDTTQSYTVAAWVKPRNLNGYQTYVSINGQHVSAFFLQLRGDTKKFAISALPDDSDAPGPVVYAGETDAPVAGQWYHLTGVYDAAAKTLSLYVNGVLQQSVPYANAFRATGHTEIGCGFYNSGLTDYASGAIDDVRFYQSALSAADIQSLAQKSDAGLPAAAAVWTFDEGTGTTAADSSGHNNTATLMGGGVDPENAWSLKYNAFPDKVLGLNIIPASVLKEEAAWYKTKLNAFGIPLDPRHTYTKGDWELWTAASTDDPALRQDFIDSVYKFADTSHARVPFSDWYDTVSGQQAGFQARPVIGGLFAILDRTALTPGK